MRSFQKNQLKIMIEFDERSGGKNDDLKKVVH
jgi:hypothetical protein